jgi:hypothetical protein
MHSKLQGRQVSKGSGANVSQRKNRPLGSLAFRVFLMIASTSSCGISSTTSAIAIAAFKIGQECAHRTSTSRRDMDQSEGGGANEGKEDDTDVERCSEQIIR